MNKNLEQLIQLSNFDKNIDGFSPKIAAIQKELSDKQNEIAEVQKEVEESNKEIRDLADEIEKTDNHIKDLNSQLKAGSKKHSAIKTERELKSLQLEEELTKDQLSSANDEIERLENLMENKKSNQNELLDREKTLKDEFENIQKSTEDELKNIESQREKFYLEKDKLVKKMDQKIISFYEKIRKWAGNTAVAKVKKQACYGCFMHINDKTYSNVIRSDEIVTCPNCGRILYKDFNDEEK